MSSSCVAVVIVNMQLSFAFVKLHIAGLLLMVILSLRLPVLRVMVCAELTLLFSFARTVTEPPARVIFVAESGEILIAVATGLGVGVGVGAGLGVGVGLGCGLGPGVGLGVGDAIGCDDPTLLLQLINKLAMAYRIIGLSIRDVVILLHMFYLIFILSKQLCVRL